MEALKAARRFSDLCDISDEDHGFVRPGDRLTFYAVAEAFLAKYLYGKVQRVTAREREVLQGLLAGLPNK